MEGFKILWHSDPALTHIDSLHLTSQSEALFLFIEYTSAAVSLYQSFHDFILTAKRKTKFLNNTSRAQGVGVSIPYILATETSVK